MTPLNRCFLFAGLLATATAFLFPTSAFAARSISQFGITWTFDRDYPTGQFANGDYWVVGPVTVTDITPRPVTTEDGSTMHGSMINPKPNGAQGFDSRIRNTTFSAAANAAHTFPLTVPPGSSILSSESYVKPAKGNDPQLKTIAILTVLERAAAPGSFRPAYAGKDKAVRWHVSQLDYSKLRALPKVRSTPSLASVEALFAKPFIDLKSNWTSGFLQPATNHPAYGREISHEVATGLLSLQLNYTDAQKEKLLVRLVQRGLDLHGLATNGATWNADGGHRIGRKPLLLLAGAVLNDPKLLRYADAQQKFIFQEDQQTWYVSLVDVARPLRTRDNRARTAYNLDMIGVAEWGIRHAHEPDADAAQWAAPYRVVCGSSMTGTVLAARLMNLEQVWNWPPLFDYIDRYYAIEGARAGKGRNQIQPFVKAMWEAYRGSAEGDYTVDNTATDEVWQSVAIPTQRGAFTCSFDVVPSRSDLDAITGLSQRAASEALDLAAIVRFAPDGTIDAYDGETFSAANVLRYTAGTRYRITMTVDMATDTYSVKVAPPGGAPVTIADHWAFRSELRGVHSLSHLGFTSTGGAHAVLDIGVTPVEVPVDQPDLESELEGRTRV